MAAKLKTWNERLVWALERRKVRKAELARACGIERSSVQEWADGKTGDPKLAPFFAACDYLRVQPRWLALGEGPVDTAPLPPRTAKLVQALEHVPDEQLHIIEEMATALARSPTDPPRARPTVSAAGPGR